MVQVFSLNKGIQLTRLTPEPSTMARPSKKAAAASSPKKAKSPKKKAERKKKDPNAPKRAQSAYMLWLNENRSKLAKPGMSVVDVSRVSIIHYLNLVHFLVKSAYFLARPMLTYFLQMFMYFVNLVFTMTLYILQAAGVEWATVKDKSKWEKQAAEEKKRYEKEMAAYKAGGTSSSTTKKATKGKAK
uniref:HMG box domain-containing protein n=1 Tax=Heterorhabditis bacteriophora TaxID=37862 RepID=A0A1I7X1Z7_HETBA